MPRVQLVSDIHVEFHLDGGKSFVQSLDPTGVDALVIAGDLGNAAAEHRIIRDFCARWPLVILVLGNHSYYGSYFDIVHRRWDALEKKLPNLHVLRNKVVQIGGALIGGTTLWFKADPLAPKHLLNDFHCIRKFEPRVYAENAAAQTFLKQTAGAVDLMVTHHIQTNQGIRPEYRGSPLNPFFVCPVAERLPKLPRVWCYGHTHTPMSFVAGGCAFVCNPFGYPHESKKAFQEKLLIEL